MFRLLMGVLSSLLQVVEIKFASLTSQQPLNKASDHDGKVFYLNQDEEQANDDNEWRIATARNISLDGSTRSNGGSSSVASDESFEKAAAPAACMLPWIWDGMLAATPQVRLF